MQLKLVLVTWCIFECVVGALTVCTLSKYEEGSGDRVQCSNATLSSALDQGSITIGAIMIFSSRLGSIPDGAFKNHSYTLLSLNIHQCNIADIHSGAFEGLYVLKKLSLPNNNITSVKNSWFKDLKSLEQLDLSFNLIDRIDPFVFGYLRVLKRLDVRENRLISFDPNVLQPMGALEKFRFSGNPLTFQCRGKLTLWLRDHGVDYKSDEDETWLDNLLWLCAIDDPSVAASEVLLHECVILNLFNQLRTGLTTAQSYPVNVPQECVIWKNFLTQCLVISETPTTLTNGRVIKRLLVDLGNAKSAS